MLTVTSCSVATQGSSSNWRRISSSCRRSRSAARARDRVRCRRAVRRRGGSRWSASAFMNAACSSTAGCSMIPPSRPAGSRFADDGEGAHRACDQVVVLVREPVAAVGSAVGGEAVDDRRPSTPARVRGRRGRRDRRRRPSRGPASLRPGTRAARCCRTRSRGRDRPGRKGLEHAGLREVGVGWRVRRARREERPRDLLHRLEVAALVRAPDLDHDRRRRAWRRGPLRAARRPCRWRRRRR